MDDDNTSNTAPQTHALTAGRIATGAPTVGTLTLRTRVVPDGWVSLDAALAWVAFGTAEALTTFPYLGANEWCFFTPERVVSVLREFAACRDRSAMEEARLALPDSTFGIIAATAAINGGHLPHPDDLAKAAEILADGLAANIRYADEQHAKLSRAAHRLRRAVAFNALPAYGWREAEFAGKGPFGLPITYIAAPRARIPPDELMPPVTLSGDAVLANIWGDWEDEGPIAQLWRRVMFDADDLLASFPAPKDDAPTVAYHLTPPEKPARRGGGRPESHDWKPFQDELIRRLALDGVELGPTDLRKRMKDWAGLNMSPVPDERTVERQIAKLLPANLFPE